MNSLDTVATSSKNSILKPNLDQLGQALELDQSSLRHGYLNIYDNLFTQDKETFIIIGNSALAYKEAKLFSEYYPNKKIYFLSCDYDNFINKNFIIHKYNNFNDLAFFIFSIDKIDVCIEHSDNHRKNKNRIFSTVFPFLKNEGLYFIEDLHSFYIDNFNDGDLSILEYINKIWELKYKKKSDDYLKIYYPFYSELIESYFNHGKLLQIIRSNFPVLKKIQRYYANHAFLYNDLLSSEQKVFQSDEYTSTAKLKVNIDDYKDNLPTTIQTPEISIRSYENVMCHPGNLLFKNGFLLPEYQRRTFRPNHQHRLIKKRSFFYVVDSFTQCHDSADTPFLGGDYFYLDSEKDVHFGHILLEQVAKLWAWDEFISEHPEGKILVGAESGTIHPLLLSILINYGIPPNKIIPLTNPVRVEHLYCPSQLYEITYYSHPEILKTWSFLKAKFLLDSTISVFPTKIFLTRGDTFLRPCTNKIVVEDICKAHGYEIIQPELLSFPDQVALFANAEKIAAFAGSSTINAIFSPDGITKTIIKSDSFTANHDYLISSIKNDFINICFCPAQFQHGKHWSKEAYMSPFTFDVDRDSEFLNAVL